MLQDDGRISLHNHLRFTILYHRDIETDLSRIVGFEVKPFSVQHKFEGTWNLDKPVLSTCNPGSMKYVSDKDEPQEVKEGKDVIFTYDVVYEVRLPPHALTQQTGAHMIRHTFNFHYFQALSGIVMVVQDNCTVDLRAQQARLFGL